MPMTPISFVDFLHRRSQRSSPMMPEADKIVPLVTQAGPAGMTRKQLGGAVRLQWHILDNLLQALISAGLLIGTDNGGGPVYHAPGIVGR